MHHSNRLLSLYLRASLLALVTTSVGCAGFSVPGLTRLPPSLAATAEAEIPSALAELTPMGPGHVFSSVESAAVDALAFCYLESRQAVAANRVSRGGAIERVPGGFSYSEPSAAGDRYDSRLRYRLAPSDAAHFRHEPKRPIGISTRKSPSLSRAVRRFVEKRDVLGRPLFYLTPDRTLRVYSAEQKEEQTLARFERGARSDETILALRSSLGSTEASGAEWPVAAQFPVETMTSH